MSTRIGGWDEGEALEFTKALKQPMVLQTPLQVILEAIFSRIQSQATLFSEVMKRVEQIEAKDVNEQELFNRIRLLEEGIGAINHEKLSPFHQQEILRRIEELEAQASALASVAPPSHGTSRAATPIRGFDYGGADHQPFPGGAAAVASARATPQAGGNLGSAIARLDALEHKLAGVYNLGGKLIALEHMAAELEIPIPDTECPLTPEQQQYLQEHGVLQDQAAPEPVDPRMLQGQMSGSRPSTPQAIAAAAEAAQAGPGGAPLPAAAPAAGASRPSTQGQPGQPGAEGQPATASSQPAGAAGGAAASEPVAAAGPGATATATTPEAAAGAAPQAPSGGPASRMGTPGYPPPAAPGSRATTAAGAGPRQSTFTPRRQQMEAEVKELSAKVAALQEDNTELHRLLEEMTQQHASLKESVAASATTAAEQLQAVEAKMHEAQEAMDTQLAAVAKEVRKPPEVSFADLSALAAKVDSNSAVVEETNQALVQIRTKELPLMKEQVLDIKDQVKRSGQPRDMDTLFHNRLTKLEGSMGDVKHEVQLAVGDILEDVVKMSDLQALEVQLEARASHNDLRQVAQQQANLAHSISQIASWITVRPDHSAAQESAKGGVGATKLRCLTCDQEVKNPGARGGGDAKARGSFLPKLDAHAAPAHAAPGGPGVNTAEMRRAAEERAAGGKGSSPLRRDVDEYVAEGVGAGGRAGSGRTAMPMNTINSVVPRAAGRAPIFI